ncbi:MAG: hypothetical protein H6815_02850 [Phycisphaeraceae bacterium]|nr:hypothetical protein [Phycisphaerales bacterium]MCB9859365.1 hypothetical protein [Phycisphaeraceae bacterium]
MTKSIDIGKLSLLTNFLIVSLVSAQSGALVIDVSGTVSPQNQSITVGVYGTFSDAYALQRAYFLLNSSEAGFGVTQYHLWSAGSWPYSPPVLSSSGSYDVAALQLYVTTASPNTPILLFQTEWTTSDFTTRDVSLSTESTWFTLFQTSSSTNGIAPVSLTNGSATIHVIPAPSLAIALLAGAGMLTAHRRRG